MKNIPYKPFWQEYLEENTIDPRIQSWNELPIVQAQWKNASISGHQCEIREYRGEGVWHILGERYFNGTNLPMLKKLHATVSTSKQGSAYLLVGKHKQEHLISKPIGSEPPSLVTFYSFAELIITKQETGVLFISLIEVRHRSEKGFFDYYLREREKHFTIREVKES